jgi:hypothetical protein
MRGTRMMSCEPREGTIMRHDATPGRNDACPCGSGRKYKRCCMAQAEGVEAGRARVRQIEARMVDGLFEWIGATFGPEILDSAWLDFLPEDSTEEFAGHPEREGAFIPWFLFNWTPDSELVDEDHRVGSAEGRNVAPNDDHPLPPLALLFAAEKLDELEQPQRDFLREACSRPFGFHQILSVEAGRSLALKEMLTGEELVVQELTGSQTLRKGEILYARTITLGGVSLMFGCAVQPLPPRYAAQLLDLRDALLEIHGRLSIEDLHALDGPLRRVYWNHVESLRNPKLPTLSNTDGDLFEPTTLRFALDATPLEAVRALAPLAIGETAEALLAAADRDAEGSITHAEIPWLKRGNKQHKEWSNTVLGTLTIEPARIAAEVNSQKRAKRLRNEIEKRLAGCVRFESQTTKSVEELRAESARKDAAAPRELAEQTEEQRALEALPEVQALLARQREEHWRHWLDTPLPALGGETPRQAVRSKSRERLEALLLEFEWDNRQGRNPMSPDVAALRRHLGV